MGDMADDMFDLELEVMHRHEDWIRSCFHSNIWVTKDERTIPLTKMTNSHLENSLKYIERGNHVYGYGKEWIPKLIAEINRRK